MPPIQVSGGYNTGEKYLPTVPVVQVSCIYMQYSQSLQLCPLQLPVIPLVQRCVPLVQVRSVNSNVFFVFSRPPYGSAFGGVTLFRPEEFRRVNGFTSEFFGWGGEDDDMQKR